MLGTLFAVSIWPSMARLTPDNFDSRSREWPRLVRNRRRFAPTRADSSSVDSRDEAVSGASFTCRSGVLSKGRFIRNRRIHTSPGNTPSKRARRKGKRWREKPLRVLTGFESPGHEPGGRCGNFQSPIFSLYFQTFNTTLAVRTAAKTATRYLLKLQFLNRPSNITDVCLFCQCQILELVRCPF